MSRIELTDTVLEAIVSMSDGNPGAVVAIMEIMRAHDDIDPQACMGYMGAIMELDMWGIYGSDIYVLFNDKCGRDVRKMLMLMRAVQLGVVPLSKLTGRVPLADDETKDLDAKVCAELVEFKRAE